jgi:hypothetical protein
MQSLLIAISLCENSHLRLTTTTNDDDDIMSDPVEVVCGRSECTNAAGTLFCGACKAVPYCSKECQKLHWKVHKQECKKKATTATPASTSTATFFGPAAALAFNPPPKEVPLQSNLGVPCYTQLEFEAMLVPPVIFPPCVKCGKANSNLWCPLCTRDNLPLECYCGKSCFDEDFDNHCTRLHQPNAMWAAAKEKVASMQAQREGSDTRMRVFDMIERMKPHPRDRLSEMQKMAQMGKSWVQGAVQKQQES